MNRKLVGCGLLIAAGLFLLAAGVLTLRWLGTRAAPPPPARLPSVEAPPPTLPPDASGDCYWNWATKPLPEISEQVQAAVREIQPRAEARAEAFGEDCIYEDGRTRFSAKETDYHVALPVQDLDDAAELGGLVRAVTDLVLERFPTGSTPGPQPGRINFRFHKGGEEKRLVVLLAEYQALPAGLSDAELYGELSKPR